MQCYQAYALMNGCTLKDIASERCLHVIRGLIAKQNVPHWELVFQVFTAKRKMFMFKIYTVESTPGWACLISTLKRPSYGAMEHPLTFITGQNTNQTTFAMKIVFTPSGFFVIMSTNGTMSIVQTVTDSPARKITTSAKASPSTVQ